jgi:DNA-binding cell septation regulator SpoVG
MNGGFLMNSTQLRRGELAAWGRPNTSSGSLTVVARRQAELRKWTPHRSGPLLGFVSVELASGLILNDLRLMAGRNGLWLAMPARRLDREGGQRIFAQLVEFRDRITRDRFNRTVLELIREKHPGALEGRS